MIKWQNLQLKMLQWKPNVSTATVSRVLNESGFVSDDIKDRVFSCEEA